MVSKIGIQEIPALQMTAIRQFIAGLCFVLYFMLVKKFPLPNRYQLKRMFILAMLMFVAANGLSTWGLKFIPTGLGALIGALYPLSVVLIERIFFKGRKISPLMMAGFLIGLIGIVVVFFEHMEVANAQSFFFGVGLSVFAMLSWSMGTIFITRKTFTINPYYGIGWQMLISAVVLWIIASVMHDTVAVSGITWKGWSAVFYLALVGSVVAFIAFIHSTIKLPIAIASLYAYVNPVVAMLLAVWLLNEPITLNLLWGAVFTLTGVFLVNYGVRRRNKTLLK